MCKVGTCCAGWKGKVQAYLLVVLFNAQGEWLEVGIYWRSCSAAMRMGRIPHLGGKRSEGLSCTHLDPFHDHVTPSVVCSAPVTLFEEEVDSSTYCTL